MSGAPNELLSLQTTIFGVKYPSPISLAPIGVQGLMHGDAELASVQASKELNVPYVMSTAASRSIEDIAKTSGDGPRFYQLYWFVFLYYYICIVTEISD